MIYFFLSQDPDSLAISEATDDYGRPEYGNVSYCGLEKVLAEAKVFYKALYNSPQNLKVKFTAGPRTGSIVKLTFENLKLQPYFEPFISKNPNDGLHIDTPVFEYTKIFVEDTVVNTEYFMANGAELTDEPLTSVESNAPEFVYDMMMERVTVGDVVAITDNFKHGMNLVIITKIENGVIHYKMQLGTECQVSYSPVILLNQPHLKERFLLNKLKIP